MSGIWLSALQQEELKRRVIELRRVREQAKEGPADLGFLRIVGDVCAEPLTLTQAQQDELALLIEDLEAILADAAQGRAIAMPRAVAPRRIVSGIC